MELLLRWCTSVLVNWNLFISVVEVELVLDSKVSILLVCRGRVESVGFSCLCLESYF